MRLYETDEEEKVSLSLWIIRRIEQSSDMRILHNFYQRFLEMWRMSLGFDIEIPAEVTRSLEEKKAELRGKAV